jgi:hypothetical protein
MFSRPLSKLVLLIVSLSLSGGAQALGGAEIAQLLNARYLNTATACVNSLPAWHCSGVLVRGVEEDHVGEFWVHSPIAVTQGAESFSYLRADVGTVAPQQVNGMVFKDQFTAISQGKTIDLLCAYPFIAGAGSARPDFGCGLPDRLLSEQQDYSSCASLGVVDADGWVAYFQQQDNQPTLQCSLSTSDAVQFNASLQAHGRVHPDWIAEPNELMVKNWDSQSPALLPIEALYYDASQPGALRRAQREQRDYFNATGDWLFILRMDLSQPQAGVFGFNKQDQLYIGYGVAAALNTRYGDTSPVCADEQPGFYCNGILFRGNDATTAFHAWNPSPNSEKINGVSFSYARADLPFTMLAFERPYGFVFKEFSAPVGHPPTLRCAYPYDAATVNAPDACTFRGECELLGVTTVEGWQARYQASPGTGCAFAATAPQFQLSIDVRAVTPAWSARWNEIMIAPWPQDIPSLLPLQALFYQSESDGLPAAQFIQHDFYQQTGQFLPIVSMSLAATDGQVFDYFPADQLEEGSVAVRRTLGSSVTSKSQSDSLR